MIRVKIIYTNKYLLIAVAIVVIFLIAISLILFKTNYNDTDILINKIFLDFESKEWRTRDAAVAELKRNETLLENDKVKQRLIKVFQNEANIETQRKKSFYLRGEQPEIDGEGYGEYYIELLVLAGKLKSPDTVPFLVNSLEYGLGVARSLAYLGDAAMPQLIEKCKVGDRDERRNCINALLEFTQHNPSTRYRETILKTLFDATKDPDERIRDAANDALKKQGQHSDK